MVVFLNGRILDESDAKVSVFDRGFLYGDGLFETLRVYRGEPFRWADHLERLDRGARFLGIKIPYRGPELREHAGELMERNNLLDCLLRVVVTRGVGGRGYSPANAGQPTLVMSLHPAPDDVAPEWRVVTTQFRVASDDPLSQFKTCNKLPQILARAEAESRGADEGLLLNMEGAPIEGTASNLFWVSSGEVCTPPDTSGILPGITRNVVLEICRELGVNMRECVSEAEELRKAEGVFLTLSSRGVVEVVELDGHKLRRSDVAGRLRDAYDALTRVRQ